MLRVIGCAIMCILLQVDAYAAPLGGVVLDQSQGMLFGQFIPSSLSLQVLQAKPAFSKSDIVIGGLLEADLQSWHGNQIMLTPSGIYNHGGGLYLTQVGFEVMANIHRALTGYISIAESGVGSGGPSGNYYYLPAAFLLLGDLSEYPAYLTVGIASIPFGVFSGGGPWDIPLTAEYFYPAQAPQLSVGYNKNDWNLALTEFRDEANYQYHSVMNVNFSKTVNEVRFKLGAGYLTHFKSNGSGSPTTQQSRRSNVPAYNVGGVRDLNGNLQYREVGLLVEYAEGSNKVGFNVARPRAYLIQASYIPKIGGEDTTFTLGHSVTLDLNNIPAALFGKDALLISLPGLKNAWSLGVARQVMIKNVVLGLELQRATTYSEVNTYTSTLDLMVYL